MKKIIIFLIFMGMVYANTFSDKDTGLMWQDEVSVKTIKKDFKGAISHCKNFKLSGFSNWRLPSRMELLSITDDTKYKPASKNGLKNVAMDDHYWSSSVLVQDSNFTWVVGFLYGFDNRNDRGNHNYIRCVRNTSDFDILKKEKEAVKILKTILDSGDIELYDKYIIQNPKGKYTPWVKFIKFVSILRSNSPQKMYFEGLKLEDKNKKAKAKRIYLVIMDRFAESSITLKVADRILTLKDIEAVSFSKE